MRTTLKIDVYSRGSCVVVKKREPRQTCKQKEPDCDVLFDIAKQNAQVDEYRMMCLKVTQNGRLLECIQRNALEC